MPQRASFLSAVEPAWFALHPEAVHPSFDEFVERYVRNFTGRDEPKAERAEGLTIDIVLSPDEAIRGCRIPVAVPGVRYCSTCGGTGRNWLFPCADCRGGGMVEEDQTLWIEVPPFTRAGTIVEAALESFGVHNFYLRVHLSIAEA